MAQYTYGKATLEGFRELHQALIKLPEEVGKKIARDATKAGAQIVKDAIYANTPMGPTGNLRKSIKIWQHASYGAKWMATAGGAIVQFSVGAKGKMGAHLHLVELGTAPHWIVAGMKLRTVTTKTTGRKELRISEGSGKRVLYDKKTGKFFGKMQLISTKPHPFVMPAFHASKESAINKIKVELASGIFNAWQRMTK